MSSKEELLVVISAIMSQDNTIRKQAEEFYTTRLQSNIFTVVQDLMYILGDHALDLNIRSLSGILLRRLIEDFYKASLQNLEIFNQFRVRLMNLWKNESNKSILKCLSHIFSQTAIQSSWPDLLPTLLSHAQNKEETIIIATIQFIEILTEYVPDDLLNSMTMLGNFLMTSILSINTAIQHVSARSICACIVNVGDDNTRNSFKSVLPSIITILGSTLSRGDEVDATNIMEYLVDIAEMHPTFFKGSMDIITEAMLSITNSESLDYSTRSIALEVLVTICESSPAIARKCIPLMKGIIPSAMLFLLELDQNESEWQKDKYSEEQVEDSCLVGEEAIERLATGLGGKTVIPILFVQVQQYAISTDYKYRRASVAALIRLAEGCTETFEKLLNDCIHLLSQFATDASCRVQYEVIHGIGRLSELYSDKLESFIPIFMPFLIQKLQNPSNCDRIRGHAASAMINLCNPESCETISISPFMEPMLHALIETIQSASVEVRQPCLVVIGCLAQVEETSFSQYYSSLMPGLKSILMTTAHAHDLNTYRGKAIECVGLIVEAVGMKLFACDATEVMNYFMKSLSNNVSEQYSDNEFDYILPACARISKAMGSQFQPYLPMIMDLLLKGANQVTNFSMTDADEDEVEGEVTIDEDTGNETTVVSFGAGVKKRVSMNTHAVQQKNQAARMLYDLASNLKGYLGVYLPPCLQTLLLLATDKHSSDIRSSSSLALSKLFDAYIDAVKNHLTLSQQQHHSHSHSLDNHTLLSEVMNGILIKLLECIKGENNHTSRICATESLRDILISCYLSGTETLECKRIHPLCCPDMNLCVTITNLVLSQCKETIQRRNKKIKEFELNEAMDTIEDKNILEEALEEDNDLLTNLVDTIGQLIKIHGETYLSSCENQIIPIFSSYFTSSSDLKMQVLSVCLIDDMIEFGGNTITKYLSHLIPYLEQNIFHEDKILRQCSVYGIAQIIRMYPTLCLPSLSSILPKLIQLIQLSDANNDDQIGITENALFAIGTICTLPIYRNSVNWEQQQLPNMNQTIGLWLHGLPLKSDEIEAKVSTIQLCEFVEQDNRFIVQYFPEILRIVAEVMISLSSNLSHDENSYAIVHPATQQRMEGLIRRFASNLPSDQVQAAFSTLSIEQQMAIRQIQ